MDRSRLPIHIEPPHVEAAFDIRAQPEPFPAPARVKSPDGAPNVLVILLDDMGFGASTAFGGPCSMPAAEQLAEGGLKFNRFHTTAICSPTRAALMTGRNHHSVGMGIVTDFATTAPGYSGMRPADAATIAQTLQANGYATGVFGKWHQVPQFAITPVGPFDQWPTSEGFDKFYGFIGGADDQFYPSLYDGTAQIEPPARPEDGYHLSEDLVNQAQRWISGVRSVDRQKPWFTYLAFGATHSPFQVPDSWRDRYRGQFEHGWDEQRERTLARQKELGVVPPETKLTDWPGGVPRWADLDDAERAVAARAMEVYAAFAEHTDAQVGRLVEFLRQAGELENTLIFYILGDNGASAEGRLTGTFNESRNYNGFPETAEEILPRIDEFGGPTSYVNYPVGWALAMDTPMQWTKQVASHFGGTRNGMIVHWPAGFSGRGEIRSQWHHVIDVAPTILEAAGLPVPEYVNGIKQRPLEGTSMLYALRDGDADEQHLTQYFEILGNRGVYHGGWTAVAKHRTPWDLSAGVALSYEDDAWELYDITRDFSQAENLADQYPEKLAELQELFLSEARRYQVLPLDDRGRERLDAVTAGRVQNDVGASLTLYPPTRRLNTQAFPTIHNRSFVIAVDLEADSARSDGVLVAIGTSFNGEAFYVREGRLTFAHNVVGVETTHIRSEEPLQPGRHIVEYHFDYDGGGTGQGGVGRLLIDGRQAGTGRVSRTAFFGGRSLTIGANPGTPVTDDYARGGEYPYTGQITSVSITAQPDVAEPSLEQVLDAEAAVQ
jgi:arylsulfatase A-like enzyme